MEKFEESFAQWYKSCFGEIPEEETLEWFYLKEPWNHQQAKIDKLEAEKKELVDALGKWQGYSDGVVLDKKGHSMTEKDIYDHVEEVLTKMKSKGLGQYEQKEKLSNI